LIYLLHIYLFYNLFLKGSGYKKDRYGVVGKYPV